MIFLQKRKIVPKLLKTKQNDMFFYEKSVYFY